MKFTKPSFVTLALALAASATPIANTIEERGLEKRDGVTCLNRGPKESRGDVIARIDAYCASHQGWTVKDGYFFVEHQTLNDHPLNIGVAGTGGCEWTIGESCYTNLRKPLDECNSEGENGKQGGFYDDACAGYYLNFVDH